MRKVLVALASLVLVSTAGCSFFKSVQKEAAKSMGVKTTTRTVKVGDLGTEYQALQGTEFDLFAAKEKPVKVQYKQFGIKSIDDFNANANQIYATFKLADAIAEKSLADLAGIVELDFQKAGEGEIKAQLSKKKKDGPIVDRAKTLRDHAQLFVTTSATLGEKAVGLKDTGAGLVSSAPAEIEADPKRAIIADQIIGELKTSVERVGEVATGAPDLVKKLGRVMEILGWVEEVPAGEATASGAAPPQPAAAQPAADGAAQPAQPAAASSTDGKPRPKVLPRPAKGVKPIGR